MPGATGWFPAYEGRSRRHDADKCCEGEAKPLGAASDDFAASLLDGRAVSIGTITMTDGTEIFYKDWGSGRPIVFSHGWPLSADDWDAQCFSSWIEHT